MTIVLSNQHFVYSVISVSLKRVYFRCGVIMTDERIIKVFYKTEEERIIKRLLLCRHGQGYHNKLDENGKPKLHIPDPELTSQGIEEARVIFSSEKDDDSKKATGRSDFHPELLFVSPLWRTLQTATYAMECHLSSDVKAKCPMVALDLLMEHNNLNACNHRPPIGKRHRETFPKVNFSTTEVEPPPAGIEWVSSENASYKNLSKFCGDEPTTPLNTSGRYPRNTSLPFSTVHSYVH